MVPKVFEPFEVQLYKADCHLHLPFMCWAPLYSSYLQECDKGCEVLCIYNWLRNPCLRHQSIISVNLKPEGDPEKGVACLHHIFPQFVFNIYSLPSKGGKEGAYYTILKKSKWLLVSFRSGGGVVDNTLDYQSRGRKIDPPLLRSFG